MKILFFILSCLLLCTSVSGQDWGKVPAEKPEPFMSSPDDYRAYIHFQLVAYQDESFSFTFIKTWDDMAKVMSEWYKELLNPDDGLKDLTVELTRADSTDISKIKSLYDFVRAGIETEDYRGKYRPDFKKPIQVFETKKGNPVEKNLLLINLLKNAGLQAVPILISTRSNGKFRPEFITTTQFNYLLAAVSKGEEYIVLDTREKYCPYGLLPDDSVVPYGFLFDREKGKLINIPKPAVAQRIRNCLRGDSGKKRKNDSEIKLEL